VYVRRRKKEKERRKEKRKKYGKYSRLRNFSGRKIKDNL
jgi:hypothetical protein